VAAKFILPAIAMVFLIAARTRRFRGPQGRVWLTVAGIFIVVSVWLLLRG
jgi:hypothetical protein